MTTHALVARAASAMVAGSLAVAATGCATHAQTARSVKALGAVQVSGRPAAASPQPRPALAVPAATTVKTVQFNLYTHCGVTELEYQGKWFGRVGGPLGGALDKHGWADPIQAGSLQVTGDVAVFRDAQGHVEKFKVKKERGTICY